jgi:hypothetical protein
VALEQNTDQLWHCDISGMAARRRQGEGNPLSAAFHRITPSAPALRPRQQRRHIAASAGSQGLSALA